MKKPSLKPCPFCGSRPVWDRCSAEDGDPNAGAVYIRCGNDRCGVSSRLWFPTMDDPSRDMAETWNRRTPIGGRKDV